MDPSSTTNTCNNDTCNPFIKRKLYSHRIYAALLPLLVMILVLECIYVFMSIPVNIGTASSITGPHLLTAKLNGMLKKS